MNAAVCCPHGTKTVYVAVPYVLRIMRVRMIMRTPDQGEPY